MSNQANEIPIDRIAIDPILQSRVRIDESVIADYEKAALQADENGESWPFPPVTLVGGFLIDGHHRYEVANRLGRSTILAIEEPGDEEDAIRAAVGANAEHGLRRNQDDVRRAISLAVKKFPGKSDREIARLVRTSHPTVGKVRRKINCPASSDVENLSIRQAEGSGERLDKQQRDSNSMALPPLGIEQEPEALGGQPTPINPTESLRHPQHETGRPGKGERANVDNTEWFAERLLSMHFGPLVRGVDELAQMLGGPGKSHEKAMDALDDVIEAIRYMGHGVN